MSEDWLRRRLADASADPPGGSGRTSSVLARLRRRQRARIAVLSTAAAGAVLVAATVVTEGGGAQSLVADDPSPSATTPGAVGPPTSATPSSAPTPTASATTVGSPTPARAGGAPGPAVGGSGGPPPRDASPLRLGFVATFSGPAVTQAPPPGAQARDLLEAWAADLNDRGGLFGRPVELLVRDDRGDTGLRRQAVVELLQAGVVAFVGSHLGPAAGDSSASALREAGVPLVGGDLRSPDWRSNPVLFAQGTLPEELGEGMLAVLGDAAEGDARDAAVICLDSDLCDDLEERVVEGRRGDAHGLRGTTVERVGVTETNYGPVVQRLKARGVELVAMQLGHQQATGFGAEFRRQAYRPITVVVQDPLGDLPDALAEQAGAAGWWGVQAVFPHITLAPGAARFRDVARGQELTSARARAWAAALLLERAVAEVGGARVTKDGLLRALRGLGGERLGGLVPRLDPGAVPPTRCLFAARVEDGRWTDPDGLRERCLAA